MPPDDYEQKLAAWKRSHGLAVEMAKSHPQDERLEDDDYPRCVCDECGGDGFVELHDAGPSYWGEDCCSELNRLVTCRSCRGTGEARK